MKVRGQLTGVGSLVPLCRSQGSNLDGQSSQPAPLSSQPSCQHYIVSLVAASRGGAFPVSQDCGGRLGKCCSCAGKGMW